MSDSEEAKKICMLAAAGEKWQIRHIMSRDNINAKYMGWTPLMWAADADDDRGCSAVMHLLRAGADAFVTCDFKKSAMHLAAQKNNTSVLQMLHSHAPRLIDSCTEFGDTPLMIAVACNHVESVKLLIHLGADVTVENCVGNSAASRAKIYRTSECILQMFTPAIESAKDHHENEDRSQTAKHLCQLAFKGHLDHLKELVTPANVNAKYREFTPLMHAVMAPRNRGLPCARLLIQTGADPFRIDNSGNSAMHVAAKFNNLDIIRFLHSFNASLIDCHAQDGGTPIMWAATADQVNSVRLLIDLGATVDSRDQHLSNAMDTAKQAGSAMSYNVMQCLGNKLCEYHD